MKGVLKIRRGRIGRPAFRALTSKRNPIELHEVSQEEILTILLANEKAAKSIMERAGGDIRNLAGLDIKELAYYPGVGEASAVKIAALFALLSKLTERD